MVDLNIRELLYNLQISYSFHSIDFSCKFAQVLKICIFLEWDHCVVLVSFHLQIKRENTTQLCDCDLCEKSSSEPRSIGVSSLLSIVDWWNKSVVKSSVGGDLWSVESRGWSELHVKSRLEFSIPSLFIFQQVIIVYILSILIAFVNIA